MKCKHCQNELPKGTTLCPTCGGENPEAAQTGLSAGKIALLVVLAVAAIAVVISLLMNGRSGTTPAGTTAPTAPTGNGDVKWVAAEAKANEILNEWLSGNRDEESFAALAEIYSEDPGSASNGGLYEDVYVGQMVPEFNDWCFDASRQYGDYGIVKTTYGYHIMYFVGSTPIWFETAEYDLMSEKSYEFVQSVLEKHPIDIDYTTIALSDLPQSSATSTDETTTSAAPADGDPNTVFCKGSYSVSGEEMATAAAAVVATMGDIQLTNAELQVYYWMQYIDFIETSGGYASMFGLDTTQPLDSQLSIEENMTWQQFFLDGALNTWHSYQAMCLEAEAAGFRLEQKYTDYLDSLPASLEESATAYGFANAEEMIQGDMGPGATLEGYLKYLNNYYLSNIYHGDSLEQIPVSDVDVEAYFDAHAEEYLSKGLEKSDESYVDVRHILIMPEGATG